MKSEKSEFIERIMIRTKQLAVQIVLFYEQIRKTDSTRVMGKQLIRSATSTAANYRSACVARSQREFYSKISLVVEEADETLLWLEMFEETKIVSKKLIEPLMIETLEIVKIVSKARKNSRAH